MVVLTQSPVIIMKQGDHNATRIVCFPYWTISYTQVLQDNKTVHNTNIQEKKRNAITTGYTIHVVK